MRGNARLDGPHELMSARLAHPLEELMKPGLGHAQFWPVSPVRAAAGWVGAWTGLMACVDGYPCQGGRDT